MSDSSTIALISAYLEEATVTPFLSGFFTSSSDSFYNSEDVELDLQRDEESVAIVVTDLSVGAHLNEATLYSNKRYTAPIYKEESAINSFDLIKRQAGQNPFESPQYAANATRAAFSIYRKLENKIRRAVEVQAAQVLQTGKLTLTNADGVALYVLDYKPKTSHFGFVSTIWATNGTTGAPLTDLETLAGKLRRDGKHEPNMAIFGESALQRFLASASVKSALEPRRMDLGAIAPETRGQGGTFFGYVWVGQYRVEIWGYSRGYVDPVSGNYLPFLDTNKVVMMSSTARLQATWGAIPQIVPPEQRALPFLPPRISGISAGLDLSTWAYVTPAGQSVMIGCGCRPLLVPVAIDSFGAIQVNATS